MDNSAIIIAAFAGTLVVFILCSFGLVFTLIHKRKQLLNKKEKLIMETKFQQELLKAEIEIQEQTLQYMSGELHDNLGQVASLIKINLNTLVFSDLIKAAEKVEFTKELTRQLISDLKSLSVRLNSDRVHERGFSGSLKIELERLEKTGLVQTHFIYGDDLPIINRELSLILFRMSQEILNNMIKHSNAKNIYCILKFIDNEIYLEFKDDGIGFKIDEAILQEGSGMKNLQKRAFLIGATYSIQSIPGVGTMVKIGIKV